MVRYGNISDLDDVLEMLNLCKIDMKERNLNIWNDNYPNEEIIKDDLLSNDSVVYDLNGKVIAFLAMKPNMKDEYEDYYSNHKNYIFIQRVMVHPSYRRMGYGQQILNFIENLGFDSIRLLTRNTNIYSVRLYTKLGYKVVREEHINNVIMQNCEKILK